MNISCPVNILNLYFLLIFCIIELNWAHRMMKMQNKIYKEIHFNDELIFPFKVNYSDQTTFIHKLPNHFHKEMEILYFQEGGVFYELENIPCKISEESIIIFPSNSIHKGTVFDYKNHKSYIYIFDLSILGMNHVTSLSRYLNPIINNELSYPFIINNSSNCFIHLKNSLLKLYDIFSQKNNFYELDIQMELLNFFSLIYKADLISNQNLTVEKRKASIIYSYIHNNYKNNIGREDLIKILGISDSHFTRLFKEISGKTFTEYLNYYRIMKSKYYLIYTKKSITDIAFDCGFQDLSYYIKVFNKFESCSPSNYRKSFS